MRDYRAEDHTFVVCAYKESPYLEACVRSLLAQRARGRVLIATATPCGHISRIADKYGLAVQVNSGKSGIAGDWNFALKTAGTALVTLAHQDDIYEMDYLEKILEAVNRCRKPLIAFSDYYEIRGRERVKKNRLLTVKRLMLMPLRLKMFQNSRFVRRRILSFGNAICCPAVTIVKDAVPNPLFAGEMRSNIDWQAWEEISRRKGAFVYVPQSLMGHRIHSASTTSELLNENRRRDEDLFVYEKFWPRPIARVIERFYQSAEKSNQ